MKSSILEQLRNLTLTIENYELIGPHVRHIIEQYRTLINSSLSNNHEVDYENKKRDFELETNANYAAATLLKIDDVARMLDNGRTVSVNGLRSTIARELAYVEDHAIHHAAIIRFILRENNLEQLVNENFGIAPSTIKYRNSSLS